jgi:hypothetical protein
MLRWMPQVAARRTQRNPAGGSAAAQPLPPRPRLHPCRHSAPALRALSSRARARQPRAKPKGAQGLKLRSREHHSCADAASTCELSNAIAPRRRLQQRSAFLEAAEPSSASVLLCAAQVAGVPCAECHAMGGGGLSSADGQPVVSHPLCRKPSVKLRLVSAECMLHQLDVRSVLSWALTSEQVLARGWRALAAPVDLRRAALALVGRSTASSSMGEAGFIARSTYDVAALREGCSTGAAQATASASLTARMRRCHPPRPA